MADIGFLLSDDRPGPQDVVRAYMLILGRWPESQAVIEKHCALPDMVALGELLLRSAEFRARFGQEQRPAPAGSPVQRSGPGAAVGLCTINFAARLAEPMLGPGWGRGEAEGRWTSGGESVLSIPAVAAHEEYLLRLAIKPYRRPRLLEVQVAGVTVLRELVRGPGTVMLRIAGELVGPDRVLTLRFINHEPERPCDVSASEDDRALAFWLCSASLEGIDRGEPPLAAAAIAPAFESLGESCEFGYYEAAIGNQPLSLFRYNSVPLAALAGLIETRLEGFPDPHSVSLRLAGSGEFVVEEAGIGLVGHVGVKRQSDVAVEEAALLRRQVARLGLLKRLFNQRVDGEGTIFVYRGFAGEPLGAMLPVWQALRRRGRNALLWVCDADATHPCGTVERLGNGLLRGYVDPGSPRVLAWGIICRRAWRLVKEEVLF